MNKMDCDCWETKIPKSIILAILLFGLILISCGVNTPESSIGKTNITASPSNTPNVYRTSRYETAVVRLSATPTPRLSNTPVPTWTQWPPTFTPLPPLPTLFPYLAKALVLDLVESNGGCNLPCWWGITPGESNWNENLQFLKSLGSYVTLSHSHVIRNQENSKQLYSYSIEYSLPQFTYQQHTFIAVSENTVQYMAIINWGNFNKFFLSEVLSSLGKPEEIYINGLKPYTHPPGPYYTPFQIVLYYPDQHVIAAYEFKGKVRNGIITMCTPTEVYPELWLWTPGYPNNITEYGYPRDIDGILRDFTFRTYNDTKYGPLPRLEDYTNMSINEFYDAFVDPNSYTCLETSESIWTGTDDPGRPIK